jgi:hypothetical protein
MQRKTRTATVQVINKNFYGLRVVEKPGFSRTQSTNEKNIANK